MRRMPYPLLSGNRPVVIPSEADFGPTRDLQLAHLFSCAQGHNIIVPAVWPGHGVRLVYATPIGTNFSCTFQPSSVSNLIIGRSRRKRSLPVDKRAGRKTHIVPSGIRALAILAGCLSGFTGFLSFGIAFLFVPVVLILGAVVQPYVPRLGGWIVATGAVILSVYAGMFPVPQAFGAISTLPLYHAPHDVGVLCLLVFSVALVVWVDVALLIDRRAGRRLES